RSGEAPTGAPYRAGRRPSRPRAALPPGYACPADSARAPRNDTFSPPAPSSLLSTHLGHRGIVCRERYYRLTSPVRQRWSDKPSSLFRGQAPRKKDTLDKVRKQLAGISALVDFWWQTVHQDLAQMTMTPKWTQWADALLLPLMYWQEHVRRTRCPGQKAQIALVLQAVEEAFERHPCTLKLTAEVLAGWKAWAGEHARAFQRASSA